MLEEGKVATGWCGAVKYDETLDWNGLPALRDPWNRVLLSKYRESVKLDDRAGTSLGGAEAAMYHLRICARIASFRLTLHDRSESLKTPSLQEARWSHLTRFGITTVRLADRGDKEAWLGTILLPICYRQELSAVHEFIILSDTYCFSSEELSLAASRAPGPYAAVNVMLIITQGSYAYENKSVIVRAGVGRMLKNAWDMTQECWEDILVA